MATTTFEQDDEITPVIFRVYPDKEGGGVIALLIEEPGTDDAYTCASYMHVGQHGAADPRLVIKQTREAKPAEYADLKCELEGAPYGYRLKVYCRLQHSCVCTRCKKIAETKAAMV